MRGSLGVWSLALSVGLVCCHFISFGDAFTPWQTKRSHHHHRHQISSKQQRAGWGATQTDHQLERSEVLQLLSSSLIGFTSGAIAMPGASYGEETATATDTAPSEAIVIPTGDAKKLFNEARALEGQGNILAAQRLYAKVTLLLPKFIYGWSNLGNTQVALGALGPADESYTKAIGLCRENLKTEEQFGVARCSDLYVIYLNRGSLRLNNNMPKEALADLELADELRGKPDAIILQNRARARELNGYYSAADRDYTIAISMTSNEVNPFWLRSALVKFQLGEPRDAFDLMKRVENRFPEAPEVRAAYSTMLAAKGDLEGARKRYLAIPDRQRLKYVDPSYLKTVVSWPPAMIDALAIVTKAVGDS